MLAEVACILGGIPLGFLLRNRTRFVRAASTMASGIIYVLLFLLGLSLGSNQQLFSRLADLGLRGFLIGLICALGSIVVTSCIANNFFRINSLEHTKAPQDSSEDRP